MSDREVREVREADGTTQVERGVTAESHGAVVGGASLDCDRECAAALAALFADL